jgi:hypothetical protein
MPGLSTSIRPSWNSRILESDRRGRRQAPTDCAAPSAPRSCAGPLSPPRSPGWARAAAQNEPSGQCRRGRHRAPRRARSTDTRAEQASIGRPERAPECAPPNLAVGPPLIAGTGIGSTSDTPLVCARCASFGPLQPANSLNGVVLVRQAHGAAPLGRRYGLRSVDRPTSARWSPGRDPHRVAFLPATPRLRSCFSDRPAQQTVACRQAGRTRTLPEMRRAVRSVHPTTAPQPGRSAPITQPKSSTDTKGRQSWARSDQLRPASATSAALPCVPT